MRVHIRGIEIVDPRVQRAINHSAAIGFNGIAKIAEHTGAKTELADRHSRAAEPAHLHFFNPIAPYGDTTISTASPPWLGSLSTQRQFGLTKRNIRMQLVVENTCPTQWRFEYESTDPELENLYELAKTNQWNVTTDINWDRDIRGDADILAREEDPLGGSKFFQTLSKQTQEEVMANQAAFTLSQFLHGEQGALLCCGELVDNVPDIEGKLYAATQVMDEARHVEVFHKYLKKLDKSYPITDGLKNVLDAILTAETWQAKCVGMQIMVESLAMGSFKNMLVTANDPLLKGHRRPDGPR